MATIINKMLRVIPKNKNIKGVDCHAICTNLVKTGGELWEKVIYYINEEENGSWQMVWTEEKIKRYYLEGLLLHEIGHQMDSRYQRYWSKNYKPKAEKFADNFAYYWGDKIRNQIE